MTPLLFLAHRIPYPPNKGDKIRSWNILRELARHYSVHLGCFIDDPADRAHQPVLETLCASCHFARIDPPLARLRSLVGLLSGAPLTLEIVQKDVVWHRETARELRELSEVAGRSPRSTAD